MKHIFLNLKRFDISPQHGGINRIAPMADWGTYITCAIEPALREYAALARFAVFLPEAHLLPAAAARTENSPLHIGCQGVYRQNTQQGGNFGAFTTNRPANAAVELGCSDTVIGHCEERNDKLGVLLEAGVSPKEAASAVNRLLNAEVLEAQKAGLTVLYCVGETSEEQPVWDTVLGEQLRMGLQGADVSKTVIAYEPVWSIGPGKKPADKAYITKIATFIKKETSGLPVVYGGGLKTDNAKMLAEIPEIDGGLIALTRFTGEIGFYPEDYLKIVRMYLGKGGEA